MTRKAPADAEPEVRRRGAPVVERVLDVTLEALAEQGFHGLSVPAVAERAGLNKTSVYRRWPTKGALVSAALERAMGHRAPLPDTGSLREDLLLFARGAVAFTSSPLGRGVLRTLMASADDPELRGLADAMLAEQTHGPRALFRRAQERGELGRDADVSMALRVVAGAIVHCVLIEQGEPTPAFVERLIALVCDGLLPTSARGESP